MHGYEQDDRYIKFRNSRFYNYYHDMVRVKNELNKNNIEFMFIQMPVRQRIKNLSDFEKERLDNWVFDFNNISADDCRTIARIYEKATGNIDKFIEYLQKVYTGAAVYEENGIKKLADYRGEYVNVINGHRITFYQPEKYINHIYIFGQCTARGTGVEDKHTIASFLQQKLNFCLPNVYCVENMAVGCGSDIHDDISNLLDVSLNPGDIVMFCTNLEIVPEELFAKDGVEFFDSSSLFNRPHDMGEWFTDMTFHTNGKGNEVIADFIADILVSRPRKFDDNSATVDSKFTMLKKAESTLEKSPELVKYLTFIHDLYHEGMNGGIVMNANPFTLGHLYLVEYASREVDHLYIFVVEEDRSTFPFKDRLALVKKGCRHLKNIDILPSGKFIISATTFPGYFLKDGNREIDVDATSDVVLFAKYIAPALGIVVRFVGEEPFDYVTRKYNEEMKRILPRYSLALKEISRRETAGEVISASRVRKLLEEKRYSELSKLVPDSTYAYLLDRYE